MTYDWNKQVEITVPTGTNGWIYSGEVIINGVKVRFPVGVPTTVPEPAAALLNKMIELEREEENNTAKPDNHYVGSVTVPEGKTLTLAKGAKVVDEDGLLGSTPAPVVILPETELAFDNSPVCPITTPFANKPTLGGTYKIKLDGTEYTTSNVVDATNTLGEGVIACYALGNADLLGFTEMLGTNPDASANIFLGLIPDGKQQDDETMYGLLGVSSEPVTTTAVLSIVQTGEASADSGNGSSGALVVTAVISGDTIGAVTVDSVSATHADMYAAIMSGRDVLCIATHPQVSSPQSTNTTILRPVRADENAIILSCKTAMNSGIEIILQVGANGESAAIMHS